MDEYPDPGDVIPFLEARYAELEAAAKESLSVPKGTLRYLDADEWTQPLLRMADEDRALREVEAGRAIIAAFRDDHRGSPDSYDGFWCAILANAYAYADHPDYRPYWKPDWKQAL